jgi:hypothetical protein
MKPLMDTSSIKSKLWIVMGVMILALLVVAGTGLLTAKIEGDTLNSLVYEDVPMVHVTWKLRSQISELRRYEKDYLLSLDNKNERQIILTEFNALTKKVPEQIDYLMTFAKRDRHTTPEIRQQVAELNDKYNDFIKHFRQIVHIVEDENGSLRQESKSLKQNILYNFPIERELIVLCNFVDNMIDEVIDNAIQRKQILKVTIIVVVSIAIIIAVLLQGYLLRAIYRAIFREGLRRKIGPEVYLSETIIERLEDQELNRK